jgi:hypothetical protein
MLDWKPVKLNESGCDVIVWVDFEDQAQCSALYVLKGTNGSVGQTGKDGSTYNRLASSLSSLKG